MTGKFIIGESSGKQVKADLQKLIETKLLLTANSGGGKTWGIRRILEETHGQVQHIVLDLEGEFHTLREHYDYVLVGKGGQLDANLKTAAVLAQRLLELNVSAIIDLYELKQHERKEYVRLFLDSMMNAPKELWHPVLVVVDEAHVLCPEKDESVAAGSVKDLCSRGRKRGFCAVLATQRLAKLAKDAAAECNNVLIGRTSQDVDMKRSGEALGFTSREDVQGLRKLEPGQFYAYGPAISQEIVRVVVGPVRTSHPKIGSKVQAVAPTSEKIKSVLAKLSDLHKEAEVNMQDNVALRTRVRELEGQLKRAPKPKADEKALQTEFNRGQAEVGKFMKRQFEAQARKHEAELKQTQVAVKALEGKLKRIGAVLGEEVKLPTVVPVFEVRQPVQERLVLHAPAHVSPPVEIEGVKLDKCEAAAYSVLASNPGQVVSKIRIAVFSGYSVSSGGFRNAISHLVSLGLVERTASGLRAVESQLEQGLALLGGQVQEPFTIAQWFSKLGACERKIFQHLLERDGDVVDKVALAEATGYQATSGGFRNSLSRLNSLELIVREGAGVKINPEISEGN